MPVLVMYVLFQVYLYWSLFWDAIYLQNCRANYGAIQQYHSIIKLTSYIVHYELGSEFIIQYLLVQTSVIDVVFKFLFSIIILFLVYFNTFSILITISILLVIVGIFHFGDAGYNTNNHYNMDWLSIHNEIEYTLDG